MAIGILLYCGSYRISYDLDKGFSWSRESESESWRKRYPKPNALVASEETIRTYLTDHGVDNIKSIKFVEPKFPKHSYAQHCNAYLRHFTNNVTEDPKEG